MSEIDFEFATQDDCLQRMVPSDLRAIISERDWLRKEKAELLEELEDRYHDTKCGCGHPACRRCQVDARTLAVINKAKGETE